MIDDDRFFGYCTQFKYLGTTFTPELNDSNDIQLRIDQGSKAFYAMNKNIFRQKDISSKLRLRTYCTQFKYLGTTFTPGLNDSNDIQLQIEQASKAFYAVNKKIFR